MHGQEKTPSPVIYNEHLVVGSTIIDGTLTVTNEDGSLTPETGAYIYIYLNNILINEDNRVIASGEERAGVVTVVGEPSNAYPVGYWSFNCKSLAYGSYITVKAQSPNKAMSDYSLTYRVGGGPTPMNIVSLKSNGLFGPPVQGDTIIEGEFSGLKRTASQPEMGLLSRPTEDYFFPYARNFDLYPYINGIKQPALKYNQIIGRNFISDFTFFGTHFDIDLLVQGEPVNIKLENFSQTIYEESVTGVTESSFIIHPPETDWDLMYVYCGGLRLAQNTVSTAYDYSFSYSPLGEAVIILNDGFNPQPTDIFYIQYIGVSEINKDNYQSVVYQGTTDEIYIIPNSNYQVYKNGLRMLEGVDYDFVTDVNLDQQIITITFNRLGGNNIIQTTDTIVIDYKIKDDVVPYYGVVNQAPAYIYPEIEDRLVNNVSTRYFYLNISQASLPDPTYLSIYKDGIKQRMISDIGGDFTLQEVEGGYYRASFATINGEEPFDYTYTVVDGVWVFTITNNFVVDFVYSDAAKQASVDMLNSLPAMVQNKIVASFNTDPVTLQSYLIFESPYTLEFPADSEKYQAFFGAYPYLYPGKDSQGHFKFFIDFKRNRWRYCFDQPLKKLMHITAATFPRS